MVEYAFYMCLFTHFSADPLPDFNNESTKHNFMIMVIQANLIDVIYPITVKTSS